MKQDRAERLQQLAQQFLDNLIAEHFDMSDFLAISVSMQDSVITASMSNLDYQIAAYTVLYNRASQRLKALQDIQRVSMN